MCGGGEWDRCCVCVEGGGGGGEQARALEGTTASPRVFLLPPGPNLVEPRPEALSSAPAAGAQPPPAGTVQAPSGQLTAQQQLLQRGVAGSRPGPGPGSSRTGQDIGAIVVEFEAPAAAGPPSTADSAPKRAGPAVPAGAGGEGGSWVAGGEGRLVATLVAVSVARSAAPFSLPLSSAAAVSGGSAGVGGAEGDWGLMVSEAAWRGARGLRGLRLRRELEARRIEHRRLAAGDDAREALVARVPLYRSEIRPAGGDAGFREVRLRLMAAGDGSRGGAGGAGDVGAAAASWHWDFAAPDPPAPAQPLLFDAAMDGGGAAAEGSGVTAGKRLEGRLGMSAVGWAGWAGPGGGREAVRWDGEGEGAAELQATVEAAAAAEALRALIGGDAAAAATAAAAARAVSECTPSLSSLGPCTRQFSCVSASGLVWGMQA